MQGLVEYGGTLLGRSQPFAHRNAQAEIVAVPLRIVMDRGAVGVLNGVVLAENADRGRAHLESPLDLKSHDALGEVALLVREDEQVRAPLLAFVGEDQSREGRYGVVVSRDSTG